MSKAGILIVEDSFIVAFHLQKTLESEGYEIISTETSGENALERLKKSTPDLVLMDIMLSGELDGIETARFIRSRYNIPVIYITALTDNDTIQRAKITEPYGYLTKPFEDREIFTVIEMALYKHKIESKLRISEERYFSTIRSINDAAILIDQEYKITYINPSAETLLEVQLHEVLGMSIFDILLLKDGVTGDFPVNPVQCSVQGRGNNSLPDHLHLTSKSGMETPIGEGSMSSIIDYKGQLMGLVIIFKDITDKVERERLQREVEKQRLAAMLEGQENERSRIAKDLHDGLGQMLNAIKMNLNLTIKNYEQSELLNKQIDEAILETIRISENLLPAKLRDFDLATCLKSLCNQLTSGTNSKIKFEVLGSTQTLHQSQKINFYRIAQEALNNALKHSKASLITVQLNQDMERVQLTIEDDGEGINNSVVRTTKSMKNGLGNMRDRAEIMGGKLTVESDQNRGTLIIVEAPVNVM